MWRQNLLSFTSFENEKTDIWLSSNQNTSKFIERFRSQKFSYTRSVNKNAQLNYCFTINWASILLRFCANSFGIFMFICMFQLKLDLNDVGERYNDGMDTWDDDGTICGTLSLYKHILNVSFDVLSNATNFVKIGKGSGELAKRWPRFWSKHDWKLITLTYVSFVTFDACSNESNFVKIGKGSSELAKRWPRIWSQHDWKFIILTYGRIRNYYNVNQVRDAYFFTLHQWDANIAFFSACLEVTIT